MDGPTRAALTVWLAPGLGPVRIATLLGRFGSPEGVIAASPAALRSVPGIGPKVAEAAARAFAVSERRVEEEADAIARAGARVVVKGGPGYPALLGEIPDAPPVLLVRGHWSDEDIGMPTVAVVGSRRSTAYGIEQAERLSGAMARSGLAVVSGGARGIDAAAHRGAMRGGGRTVVVLGSGLLMPYPPEHAELFDRVVDSGGAVVSELPCRTPPAPEQFPRRNRIISGLSLGVLVIEAGRKSGALITARQAGEEHGREVMAVPGRIDSDASRGSLDLLKDGATLVTDPEDILQALEHPAWMVHRGVHADRFGPEREPGVGARERTRPEASVPTTVEADEPADAEAARLLRALDGAMTPDELGAAAGLDSSTVRRVLTVLELGGRVKREGVRVLRA
jgi:DNA processing protein